MVKKAVLFCFSILVFATVTKACVCDDWTPYPNVTTEHLKDKTYVFVTAKVLDIKVVRKYGKRGRKFAYKKVTVEIVDAYNFDVKRKTLKIGTGMNQFSDCGFPFEKNQTYLVTLTKPSKKNHLRWTSVCLPTRLVSDAKEDLKLLETRFRR